MPNLSDEVFQKKQAQWAGLREDRLPWWNIWRDLADYYLPKRYVWLLSDKERKSRNFTNPAIIDGTGTQSARILAAGLMNGIASPSRPWFKLKFKDWTDDLDYDARVWLDECERRLRYALGASNFYNTLAVYFLDLAVFGTSAFSIFEDPDKIFHCQNHALGEYYVEVDGRGQVCTFAREFTLNIYQMVKEFGEENCSASVREAWNEKGARLREYRTIRHLVEPNYSDGSKVVPESFTWRELYWDTSDSDVISGNQHRMLRAKGYNERPTIVTRWEVSANDAYGTSPGMDALGDVKQLQHESKRKAQGVDKMVSPPMLADIQLQNQPMALLPNGITYVARLDANTGARPAYQVSLPLGEVTADINQIQQRIANIFYNFLFNKVMNLATVRSAREIDSIESERLVLLGAVLERFENEGLDPALERFFSIMLRRKLLPPVPPSVAQRGAEIEVEYVSILSAAQSAAGTASTERFLQLAGSVVSVWPEIREVPEIVNIAMDYARDIGVPAKNIRSKKDIAAIISQQNNQAQQQQTIDQAEQLAGGAKVASETQVGGGMSLLQQMLGGAQ
jgi:hypothetical protein